MSDRLAAMLELAAMRDGLVVRLFVTAAATLISAGLLRVAPFPPRLRSLLINTQAAAALLGWVMLLVIVGFLA